MTAQPRAIELATAAAKAADSKKGEDVVVLDVSGPVVITDAFVLVSADNERLVAAIVDEIEDDLRDLGAKPVRREGVREGRWALLDYGDIVVHVFRASRSKASSSRVTRTAKIPPVMLVPSTRFRWLPKTRTRTSFNCGGLTRGTCCRSTSPDYAAARADVV